MLSLEPTDHGEVCPNCGEKITSTESSLNPQCPGCGVYLNKLKKREEQNIQSSKSSETVGVQRAPVPVSENPAVKYLIGLAIVIATVFGIKYAIIESGYISTSDNSEYYTVEALEKARQENAEVKIDYVAQSDKVELYVFSWCKTCHWARDDLKRRNIDFVEYDFKTSEHGKKIYSMLENRHKLAPIYIVDDKVILGGYVELVLEALEERKLKE